MLDGDSGSFAWSAEDPHSPLSPAEARRLAWSSNLRWSVTLHNEAEASVTLWDEPNREDRWEIREPNDVRSLFDNYRSLPQPTAESVIIRALNTFSDIRAAVENRGGTPLDVTIAFNAVIGWAAHTETLDDVEFSNAVQQLFSLNALGFGPDAISRRLRRFPIGTLVQQLKEGRAGDESFYLLDADLLIRHASGRVYQEAHKWLREPSVAERQTQFSFGSLVPRQRHAPRRPAPSDIHHTPASLARSLVEVALKFLQIPSTGEVDILDPSCGSGVFLVESLRAIHRTDNSAAVCLHGIDKSDIAIAMADACLRHVASGHGALSDALRLQEADSLLESTSWGSPRLIVMNPPFVAWNSLSRPDRERVKATLGPAYHGRPDTTCAFIFRGMEALAPGGVLASVVPSTLLESESAEIIRQHVMRSGEYRVHLIGQFGFGYFRAAVQPAFIVLSRLGPQSPVRVVTADHRHSDDAIRAIRLHEWPEDASGEGYEIYSRQQYELSPERLTPLPQEVVKFADTVSASTTTTVADFFIARLGIRVGGKGALILDDAEYAELCTNKKQRSYFRPVADRVENGAVIPSGHIFYPYNESGELLLQSEDDLKSSLSAFYEHKLLGVKRTLSRRGSRRHRQWWEVSEPVKTWLAKREARIVCQEFGGPGNFAVDASGDFAVVQGFGWCWTGTPHPETLFAYAALLNSQFFGKLLSAHCPRVQGGQFVLRRYFIERVPLPELKGTRIGRSLAAIGRRIADCKQYDEMKQESLVRRAYMPEEAIGSADVLLAKRFRQLSDQLQGETRYLSRASRVVNHPLYREVVSLGQGVVPLLINDMKESAGGMWSSALAELTGANPRGCDADSMDDIVNAWVRWGRETGYDV